MPEKLEFVEVFVESRDFPADAAIRTVALFESDDDQQISRPEDGIVFPTTSVMAQLKAH